MADDTEGSPNWIGWIMMGLLALLSLACIIGAGILYVWIFADWLQGSGGFTGLQMIGWMVGLIAAAVIGVGLLLAGLFLRFLTWPHAPLASLVLSIISTGFVLMTYLVYSDTGHESDSIELVLLQASCILGLFVIALPPFLHWLLARRRRPVNSVPKAT